MIHVQIVPDGNGFQIWVNNNGSFSRPFFPPTSDTILRWMTEQWGAPGFINRWEVLPAVCYIMARVSDPNRAMEAKLRWHGYNG